MPNIEKEFYQSTLNEIKSKIVVSQNRAVFSVNHEMIILYWEVGKIIAKKQQDEGWGSAVIPRLSRDLKNDFPEKKGFSERNIKRMLRFYKEYNTARENKDAIVPQAVAQLEQLIFATPWGHNMMLIEKVKDREVRLFYMQKVLEEGYSRDILKHMIESELHIRSNISTS